MAGLSLPDGPIRASTLDGEGEPLVVEPAGSLGAAASAAAAAASVLVLPPERDRRTGRVRREVVVDGWRFDVELEPERRAALRERAARAAGQTGHHGALEVRAVIPGRVVSVAVAPGQDVEAGDRLLVVEAMKMQNEVRAPRAGHVARLGVGAGQTVELGDLLVVID